MESTDEATARTVNDDGDRMSKLRRITIPIVLVAGSWYYEVRSYQPPPPTPASTDLDRDTGGALD